MHMIKYKYVPFNIGKQVSFIAVQYYFIRTITCELGAIEKYIILSVLVRENNALVFFQTEVQG